MRTWVDVATLVKMRSLKGRFIARYAMNLPFVLESGMEVAFVPPRTDVIRRAIISEVALLDDRRFEIRFHDVEDAKTCNALVGCHCLIRRSSLDGYPQDDDPSSLIGWTVRQEDGVELGTVSAVIHNPGQDLLEIHRMDGAGEALIPLVDEFLVRSDSASHVIVVELPSGLLDL